MSASRISIAEFDAIIREDLTWAHDIGMRADEIAHGRAILRLPFRSSSLRPGGVVSGPSIMALADACMYAVVLSAIGSVKLAVTTSFNINFLYGALPVDLLAEGSDASAGKATGGDRGAGALGRSRPAGCARHRHLLNPAGEGAVSKQATVRTISRRRRRTTAAR